MFHEPLTWRDEIESFRLARLASVWGNVNSQLDKSSGVFIHVLPLGRLHDIQDLRHLEGVLRTRLAPPTSSGHSSRFNADGFMHFDAADASAVRTYTQWFRFGGVEGFSSQFIRDGREGFAGGNRIFFARNLTNILRQFVGGSSAALLEVFQQDPPYGVAVSIIGAAGSLVVAGESYFWDDLQPIASDRLLISPVVIEEPGAEAATRALQPVIDIIWQSGGFAGDPRERQGS